MCNNPEVLTYDWMKTGGRSGPTLDHRPIVLGNMNKRLRRVMAWTFGMAIVGAFLGMPVGYPHTWYQAVVGDPAPVLWGAGAGLVFGLFFSSLVELLRGSE